MKEENEFVFEFEMGGEGAALRLDCATEVVRTKIQRLCQPKDEFNSQLARAVGGRQQFGDDVVGEVEQLARRLCDLGYRVLIRKTTGGGRGVACFENLRHSYLVVVPSEGCPKQVVVEPRFKDQFVIANPTRAYETLLDLVPETFVGTVTDLMAAVDVLCKEMSTSFRRMGRPLPPWRRKKSLASKWQPKRCQTEDVDISHAKESWKPGILPETRMLNEGRQSRDKIEHLFVAADFDELLNSKTQANMPRTIVVKLTA